MTADERIAALEAKCALLAASWKAAEEELSALRARCERIREETIEECAKQLESFCLMKKWLERGDKTPMPYHDSCPPCQAARQVRALAQKQEGGDRE